VKRVLILGSTGSIGRQALEVISADPTLQVTGLGAGSDWQACVEQAREHGVPRIAISDPDAAERAAREWSGVVLGGPDAQQELISGTEQPGLVLNAIVGAAGLAATVVALGEGHDLALANKESLVVGGDLVMALAEATGSRILPVDSEHSALWQLIDAAGPGTVERATLTASGGPLRGRASLDGVRRDEVLDHPTWEMGGKITVDSATLMNKGLEVIEAHHLFSLPYDVIDVVVHPQSIVHALAHLNDGSSLAHMGYPDMRVPISFALHYPERGDVALPGLDLTSVGELTFEEPDTTMFPCLGIAIQAGKEGGTRPCVLNAANEVAVAAFLEGRAEFEAIPRVVAGCLDAIPGEPVTHFEQLFETDALARETASALLGDAAPA